jgi:hypothetical protein
MRHPKSAIFFSLLAALIITPRIPARETPHHAAPVPQATEPLTALPSGAPLSAELDSSLDSKKAKVGDQVTAHTTEALKSNGTVVLPKNVKLFGHITQSSARSKGDPSSALAILFDKAVIKKGQEIPLKVVIQAIAAPPHYSADSSPDLNSMPPGTAAAQGSPMGGSRSPAGGAPSTPSRPSDSSNPADNRNSADPSTGGLDQAGRLTSSSRGVIGLPGLHLATDETSAEKGSLITTSEKSVRLESGVKLLLLSL